MRLYEIEDKLRKLVNKTGKVDGNLKGLLCKGYVYPLHSMVLKDSEAEEASVRASLSWLKSPQDFKEAMSAHGSKEVELVVLHPREMWVTTTLLKTSEEVKSLKQLPLSIDEKIEFSGESRALIRPSADDVAPVMASFNGLAGRYVDWVDDPANMLGVELTTGSEPRSNKWLTLYKTMSFVGKELFERADSDAWETVLDDLCAEMNIMLNGKPADLSLVEDSSEMKITDSGLKTCTKNGLPIELAFSVKKNGMKESVDAVKKSLGAF